MKCLSALVFLVLLAGLVCNVESKRARRAKVLPTVRFQDQEPTNEPAKNEPTNNEGATSTTTTEPAKNEGTTSTTTEPAKNEGTTTTTTEPAKNEGTTTTTTEPVKNEAPPATEPKIEPPASVEPPPEAPKAPEPEVKSTSSSASSEQSAEQNSEPTKPVPAPETKNLPAALQEEPPHTDPCVLGTWVQVDPCSATCGVGVQKFHLTVREHSDAVQCGVTERIHECNNGPCPVDCVMGNWATNESCSRDCGGGSQTFVRPVLTHPAHGGRKCPPTSEVRECNKFLCHQDCEVSDWFPCKPCSAECGPGSQEFCRNETKPALNGGRPCPTLTEKRACSLKECPVDCAVSAWMSKGDCSRTCQGGVQHFYRHIVTEPQHGGRHCPPLEESRLCEKDSCPSDCEYGDFEAGPCSKECGGGHRNFTRTIKIESNSRGRPCTNTQLTLECNTFSCTNDCQVSDFTPHGTCNAKCGGGTLEYTRVVIRQASEGGRECPYLSEHRPCNTHPCE